MIFVQLILVSALFICLGIGVFIFVKSMKEKQGQKALLQFAGIEFSIFVVVLIMLLTFPKSDTPISVSIIIALILTLFANIPIGFIALIVKAFTKKK